jgi:localization factor PodJL
MTTGARSQAKSLGVDGIDPKVREAAREAAARQGMSLAEYLNHALASSQPSAATGLRARARMNMGDLAEDGGDPQAPLRNDPGRLSQRIEQIERRMQLAVSGLDRAVSTIDRSVLGLASRIDEAESISNEAADRVAEAIEHFRAASDTLSGHIERSEAEAHENRRSLDSAKERLEAQVAVAEEVARRAEAAANFLATHIDNRDEEIAETLVQARSVAEDAARQAAFASSEAVNELRRLQETLNERLAETEISTRRAVADAVESVRQQSVDGARDAIAHELERIEAEVTARVGSLDQLKSEHATLLSRVERAEANARESTAGLRQAAGAAIADLRNAQLGLAARVKQVEDVAGSGIDLSDIRYAQQDIAERLAQLETRTATSPVNDALAAFEARLASVESGAEASARADQVDGVVRTLDASLQRLAARIVETESTANTAIRTLEETVSSIGARVEQVAAAQETEALRAMLEQRLDTMAQSVTQMVGEARSELAGQLQAAMEGVAEQDLEGALTDVNNRLAVAERRQAHTIEAISLEIKRMSESVDKRLRTLESRNDDAAASAVREELSRMATTLEQRFDEIEHREAAAFDRMGLEVGRLSERLEERVGAVESRSAEAIEHVGEQVARMAERFNQRHETLTRELGDRMVDSEERSGQRVSEAISSIMQRLAEVETSSAEAIAPVHKAVSRVASKLEQYESARNGGGEQPQANAVAAHGFEDIGDYVDFDSPDLPSYSPPESEPALVQPEDVLHAGAPEPKAATVSEDDIYFSDADDLLVDDLIASEDASAPDDAMLLPLADMASERTLDDELLAADPIAQQIDAGAPPDEGDQFWMPQADVNTDLDAFRENVAEAAPFEPAEPQAPPSKNAYLDSARKAAQAQAKPEKTKTVHAKPMRPDVGATSKLNLRGPSRIVLWGTASIVALLLIGGARYLVQRSEPHDAAPEPENVLSAPPTVDPLAPETSPTDPDAPAALEDGAAVSEATPTVAGPLAPRNVSLEQAAQGGDLTAQYELALQRLSAGRTQEGVALLRGAADRGFAMAQYRLGKLYERGEGVQADLAVARQWTERAAASGNRRAMHDLGVYFARGEGAPLDEAAAFRWFRQAAELGVADSQYNLGILYQQGRGVNASAPEALFWFLVASRQGDTDAAARAAALEAQLTQAQVDQAHARAEAFRPRAANAVANGEFGTRPWAQTRPGA